MPAHVFAKRLQRSPNPSQLPFVVGLGKPRCHILWTRISVFANAAGESGGEVAILVHAFVVVARLVPRVRVDDALRDDGEFGEDCSVPPECVSLSSANKRTLLTAQCAPTHALPPFESCMIDKVDQTMHPKRI